MAKGKQISIKWSDELQSDIELIVNHFAAEMGVRGIATRSATRQDAIQSVNTSGGIEFAVRKLAEEIRSKEGS